jgi:hypothetical protein
MGKVCGCLLKEAQADGAIIFSPALAPSLKPHPLTPSLKPQPPAPSLEPPVGLREEKTWDSWGGNVSKLLYFSEKFTK